MFTYTPNDVWEQIIYYVIPKLEPKKCIDTNDYYRLMWLLKGIMQQGQNQDLFEPAHYYQLWTEIRRVVVHQFPNIRRHVTEIHTVQIVQIVAGNSPYFCCVCDDWIDLDIKINYSERAYNRAKPRCKYCYLDTSKIIVKEKLLSTYGIQITKMKEFNILPIRDIRTAPFKEYFTMEDIRNYRKSYPEKTPAKNNKRKWNVANFVRK